MGKGRGVDGMGGGGGEGEVGEGFTVRGSIASSLQGRG